MMLSNFAFIKETSDLVFLVFASVKQNYSYKNLWLAAKKVWVCGGTLVLLCILQQGIFFAGDVLIINGISCCRNMLDFGQ
jgi:hypothetical protein